MTAWAIAASAVARVARRPPLGAASVPGPPARRSPPSPATSAAATTPAVASTARFRRANFRSRYRADGGPRLHRLVGQVPLARPRRSRWPSRTGGCGPSPAPSSRSSPARPRTSRLSCAGVQPAGWPTTRRPRPSERAAAGCSAAAAPPPGSSAASRRSPACLQPLAGRTASCRSAARTAARRARRRRSGCRRPGRSARPAPGLMYAACRPLRRSR